MCTPCLVDKLEHILLKASIGKCMELLVVRTGGDGQRGVRESRGGVLVEEEVVHDVEVHELLW